MKSILITGGTGSFGNAFVDSIIGGSVERICVFSRDEVKQAEMRERLLENHKEISVNKMRWFIGDVRDLDRLRRAFDGVDTVIHAAALKRIEVGYYNPEEMIKTNVIGAMNVISAAHDTDVKKVVALSTDKAHRPVSAYGHSKALAECLFINANNSRGAHGPRFSVTRYGNVAGSRGSVIPKWKKMGEVVPVTHPEATRFWMTIDQACDLVFGTSLMMPSKIVTPTLSAYRLGDLAEAMGKKMSVTGLPEWEKMHESMRDGETSETARRMTVEELRNAIAASSY